MFERTLFVVGPIGCEAEAFLFSITGPPHHGMTGHRPDVVRQPYGTLGIRVNFACPLLPARRKAMVIA
jgi:hypothetical protein